MSPDVRSEHRKRLEAAGWDPDIQVWAAADGFAYDGATAHLYEHSRQGGES